METIYLRYPLELVDIYGCGFISGLRFIGRGSMSSVLEIYYGGTARRVVPMRKLTGGRYIIPPASIYRVFAFIRSGKNTLTIRPPI